MIKKILKKMAKVIYPGRDIRVRRIRRRFFLEVHDTVGDYLLEGTYSYNEVVKLNALTNYSARFGFCSELGPVAFIGIPNVVFVQKRGYFEYKVQAYGTSYDWREYYFRAYTEEEAKNIENYTVYGFHGLDEVALVATISQMFICLRFEI